MASLCIDMKNPGYKLLSEIDNDNMQRIRKSKISIDIILMEILKHIQGRKNYEFLVPITQLQQQNIFLHIHFCLPRCPSNLADFLFPQHAVPVPARMPLQQLFPLLGSLSQLTQSSV